MGEEPPADARRGYEAARRRGPRAADPGRPVRADLRRLRAREGARGPDRLRRPAASTRSTCSRPTPTPRDRRARASAGSASTSTRTRTRSSSACSSCGWATSRDLCVVGDEDQTIYTFTGATSRVPDRLRRPLPGARVVDARRELPLHAAGPRARQPLLAATGRDEAPRRDTRPPARSPTITQLSATPRRSWTGSTGWIRGAAARTASQPRRSPCWSGSTPSSPRSRPR